jgi:sRNA-binding carbon storage regulator CsrA
MLVIARKRHEAVTIDGNIRVELLQLTGGLARLRFVAPRCIAIQRGVARPGDPSAYEAVNGGIDAAGMGVVDLTLGDQQIITVRSDVHIGLVDIDATRAVLFVDAPDGMSVNVESAVRPRTRRLPSGGSQESVQALLPFAPPTDVASAESGRPECRKSIGEAPRRNLWAPTLPFPKIESEQDRRE